MKAVLRTVLPCVLCALLSCTSGDDGVPTQVLVLVDAQAQVQSETDKLALLVESRSGAGSLLDTTISPSKWPIKLAIVPRGGDATRSYLVTVQAKNDRGETISVGRLLSGFVEGERRYVYLLLEDECLGRPDLCKDETTCHAGGCVSAEVSAADFGTTPENAPRSTEHAMPIDMPTAGSGGAEPKPMPDAGGRAGTTAPPPPDVSDLENGEPCKEAGECKSGSCVAAVCCAEACDAPPACRIAEGATCEDGATCVYPPADEDTECDDGDPCSSESACRDGACVATAARDCDDDNVCTADSCDPERGCLHDGTGITTAGCLPDDECGKEYTCAGNLLGDCIANMQTDCSTFGDECTAARCDPKTGCFSEVLDGTECEDGDACTVGDTCADGSCMPGEPRVCPDDSECSDAACDSVAGCILAHNTEMCDDDDPCTDNDRCMGGTCSGTPMSCGSLDDSCNAGVCEGGSCVKEPRNDDMPCDDGNSCSFSTTCDSGSCGDGQNACGDHATACTPGSPNSCSCASAYQDNGSGMCVPNVNECAGGCGTAACHAQANCTDPTPTCGDRVCQCKTGFTGNGLSCTDINECSPNPCSPGTCTQGVPGTYSCNCGSGYLAARGGCVCDMTGTFAVRADIEFTWSGISSIADGSGVTQAWQIRRQTYAGDGTLTTEIVGCGSTAVDLCGLGVPPVIGPEAYGTYYPVHIWGTGSMPNANESFSILRPLPNAAFTTPNVAMFVGISLTDPFGPWPASTTNVGGGAPTNGATWRDHDADGRQAVTSYMVPPQGIGIDGTPPDPPFAYGNNSSACSRAYAYWPALESTNVRRVTRVYGASRTISRLEGQIMTCDRIVGEVHGPDNGEIASDSRVAGCARLNGSSEIDCTATVTSFMDGQGNLPITGATFVMRRVQDGITCAQVRALTY